MQSEEAWQTGSKRILDFEFTPDGSRICGVASQGSTSVAVAGSQEYESRAFHIFAYDLTTRANLM